MSVSVWDEAHGWIELAERLVTETLAGTLTWKEAKLAAFAAIPDAPVFVCEHPEEDAGTYAICSTPLLGTTRVLNFKGTLRLDYSVIFARLSSDLQVVDFTTRSFSITEMLYRTVVERIGAAQEPLGYMTLPG